MKKYMNSTNPAQVYQKAILDFTTYAIQMGYLTESQVVEVLEALHSDILKKGNKE